MDNIISKERLSEIYEQSACEVTQRTSGIQLNQGPADMDADVCTVYTDFNRGVYFGLALCAETDMLRRLTQNMMGTDQVDFQDVEDFSKEYFNVLCGHIAGAVFRDTKVAARFQIPTFHRGWYHPENRLEGWELDFLSDRQEGIRLIHYQDSQKA